VFSLCASPGHCGRCALRSQCSVGPRAWCPSLMDEESGDMSPVMDEQQGLLAASPFATREQSERDATAMEDEAAGASHPRGMVPSALVSSACLRSSSLSPGASLAARAVCRVRAAAAAAAAGANWRARSNRCCCRRTAPNAFSFGCPSTTRALTNPTRCLTTFSPSIAPRDWFIFISSSTTTVRRRS